MSCRRSRELRLGWAKSARQETLRPSNRPLSIALPFKILALKLRYFPADVESVSHLARLDNNGEERCSIASAIEASGMKQFRGRRSPEKKLAQRLFLANSSTSLACEPAASEKKTHLLDSERIGLHRVLGQEAAGAAVGEGIRRRREGDFEGRLSKFLRLLLYAKDCGEQQRERHEARPEPLSPAPPRGQRRRRSPQQDDLGERRRRRAALESSRGGGMEHNARRNNFSRFALSV